MLLKILLVLSVAAWCECAYLYSSFYAPLVNPRILGYRVDARFDEESGRRAREGYQSRYGYRGQNLIEDLGNGRRPKDALVDNKVYSGVKFYYTYPGAYNSQVQ